MFLVLGSISDYGGGYFAWVSVEELTNTGRKYLDVNFLSFIIERRTIVLRGTFVAISGCRNEGSEVI